MRIVVILIVTLLVACATTRKFDRQNVDTSIAPRTAATEIGTLRGKKVLWGGMIVNSKNLEQGTMLEVLAYPLNDDRRPQVDREPLGRFIVEHASYLETVDYAPGRELTVIGTLTGTKEGKIDETLYTYPAVATEQLHLWAKTRVDTEPRVRFGIGVMIHN
jgi:outer membrane lipoprotein